MASSRLSAKTALSVEMHVARVSPPSFSSLHLRCLQSVVVVASVRVVLHPSFLALLSLVTLPFSRFARVIS